MAAQLNAHLLRPTNCAACYLPCDPSYPDDRLAVYLEDAGAAALVTTAAQARRAERLVCAGCQVVDVAAACSTPVAQSAPSSPYAGPQDPAYIIFTSGSTGRPKGVVVPHVALMDHLHGTAEYFGMGPASASLLTITINFDPHLMQALSPLVVGGRLVIARPGAHGDADYVTRVLAEQCVTHFVSTPSLALVQFKGQAAPDCTALRALMFGGEQLPRELVTMLAAKACAAAYRCWGWGWGGCALRRPGT